MQSGLGTVSETTQNVYDEVKAKKTPGDNWFGFGFAFFLGWSHIPAPHLKARRVMKGSLALLYYKYKIIYTKLQKEFGMLWNILAWKIGMCGGIKSKEKEWNHLEQRGGTSQSESKCILWRLLWFRRSEQAWRLCSDLVKRDKFSFLSVSIISSNQDRNKWSSGKN